MQLTYHQDLKNRKEKSQEKSSQTNLIAAVCIDRSEETRGKEGEADRTYLRVPSLSACHLYINHTDHRCLNIELSESEFVSVDTTSLSLVSSTCPCK